MVRILNYLSHDTLIRLQGWGLSQMNAQMTFERSDFLADVGDSTARVSLEFAPTVSTNQN